MKNTRKIPKKAAEKQLEKNWKKLNILKPVLRKKDFKSRIKKAGKAFTKGLKPKKVAKLYPVYGN